MNRLDNLYIALAGLVSFSDWSSGPNLPQEKMPADSQFMLRIGARPINTGIQLLWEAVEATCQAADGQINNCSLSLHAECRAQIFRRAEGVLCLSCTHHKLGPCLEELFSPGPRRCLHDKQCRQEDHLTIQGGWIHSWRVRVNSSFRPTSASVPASGARQRRALQ